MRWAYPGSLVCPAVLILRCLDNYSVSYRLMIFAHLQRKTSFQPRYLLPNRDKMDTANGNGTNGCEFSISNFKLDRSEKANSFSSRGPIHGSRHIATPERSTASQCPPAQGHRLLYSSKW